MSSASGTGEAVIMGLMAVVSMFLLFNTPPVGYRAGLVTVVVTVTNLLQVRCQASLFRYEGIIDSRFVICRAP
jgi:hypothetical protein